MNLKVSEWKPFRIMRTESQSGLFEIENCKCGNAGDLDDGTDINYIGAKKSDNGVMRSVSLESNNVLVSKGHGIIFICDGEGSVGYTNYMDSDFIGSTTLSIGYDDALTETNAMFLVSVLDNERFKYSYGRKYRKNLISAIIYLPVQQNIDGSFFIDSSCKYSDEGYVPDWQFMEDYIKSLHHKPLTTKNKPGQAPELNVSDWKEFAVPELFGEVKVAKSADIGNLEEGKTPFIGRTDVDNGVQGFVDPISLTKGKCITISMVGTNVALYQEEDFQASQNIAILRKDGITKAMALFICSMINFEMRLKYSYGRTVGKANIEEMIIKLPIDSDGNPDWQFMEDYIKSLPYGDRLEG